MFFCLFCQETLNIHKLGHMIKGITSSGTGFRFSFTYPTEGGINALLLPGRWKKKVNGWKQPILILKLVIRSLSIPPTFMPINTSFKPLIICRGKKLTVWKHNFGHKSLLTCSKWWWKTRISVHKQDSNLDVGKLVFL